MKIVVAIEPDNVELTLNDLSHDDFIYDPDTYYYFRDQVFIEGIKNFINKNYPGKVPPGKIVDGFYHSTNKLEPPAPVGSGVAKVKEWYDTQDVIIKYYKKWAKKRPKSTCTTATFTHSLFWDFKMLGMRSN